MIEHSPIPLPIPDKSVFFICPEKFIQKNRKKNIDFRLEGYIFLAYQALLKGPDSKAFYGGEFDTKHYIATAAAVYHSPLGPVSFSVNYYDKSKESFSFLFHFGYIIFNRKALD